MKNLANMTIKLIVFAFGVELGIPSKNSLSLTCMCRFASAENQRQMERQKVQTGSHAKKKCCKVSEEIPYTFLI